MTEMVACNSEDQTNIKFTNMFNDCSLVFLLKHFHLLSLSIRYALDRQTDLRVALGLLASPRPGGESDEKGRQAGGLGP